MFKVVYEGVMLYEAHKSVIVITPEAEKKEKNPHKISTQKAYLDN